MEGAEVGDGGFEVGGEVGECVGVGAVHAIGGR